MTELSCAEMVELVTAYLDGAMDEPTRHRFEQHLLTCEGCDRYLDQIRLTIDELGRLTPDQLPDTTRDALLAAFRDWSGGREPIARVTT